MAGQVVVATHDADDGLRTVLLRHQIYLETVLRQRVGGGGSDRAQAHAMQCTDVPGTGHQTSHER